eukprot:Transcript_13474.p1 GENE.Transcript_13474~~Transcript_13474.p1  ORF type:complete len:384 (-),score=144.34 Transcript_13474:60-1211(-)
MQFTDDTPRFHSDSQRWSFQNNAICGICLGQWAALLWHFWRHIEWRAYWQRVVFVSALAVFNSLLALVEHALYGRAIARQRIHPRPLFVLGHPRTGTTLLHSLLALDDEFGTCSTFCAGFPSSFLWFERFKWLLSGMIGDKRPMDNMELSFDTVQEDEIATSVLSAGTSPYMPLVFMTAEPSFRPYFSFEHAPDAARRRWTDAFLYLLRKLTLRARGRPLLLKSPVHTARVALLLRLFPEARFVYIHRDPAAVYRSACHMAATTYPHMHLATPTDAQVHEFILHQFELLWREYAAARELVPRGSLAELSYAELTADPAAAVGRVYRDLGLQGYEERVRLRVAARAATLVGYQTNCFEPLPAGVREVVARRWAAYTKAWGYEWK